uniref:[acyl-carrier-protein] S-malonyltransferase n=1 Tax=Strigamia maritima TaxID=126957 RepID=T1J2B6_STRMM
SRNYVSNVKENGELVDTNKPENTSTQSVTDLLKSAASFKDDEPKSPDDLWSSSAYPKGANPAENVIRPKVDPKDTSIILFPGQGSQFVGMGKMLIDYPNVKEMFSIASDILKYDLQKLCFEGPISELNKTSYCQPAILVTSLAAVEKLKVDKPQAVENCIATAGFSVGEFSALVFADCISFHDAISVMKVRAEAMQYASEIVPSGMMTVFFGADNRVNYACCVAKQWCRKLGIENPECRIANYLHPTCKVIAGNEEALQFIEMNAQDFGIRRLKRLAVSGAFHTDLMIPAEEPLKIALRKIKIKPPLINVHSNVDGKQYVDINHIYRGLIEQISSPVKWEQILHFLYERSQGTNYPETYECGPGRQLTAILKLVNGKAAAKCEHVKV